MWFNISNKMISAQCATGLPVEKDSILAEKFKRMKPLFMLIGKSFVI
jgi:hypothetical protein